MSTLTTTGVVDVTSCGIVYASFWREGVVIDCVSGRICSMEENRAHVDPGLYAARLGHGEALFDAGQSGHWIRVETAGFN